MKDIYPETKKIISLLGIGAILAGSFLMPGLAVAAGSIARIKRRHDFNHVQREWKKFNQYYLKKNIKRLHDQKIIEITEKDGQEIIKLTEKGQTKYLRFRLQVLSLKNRSWDGKWRLVIYDINRVKRAAGENLRKMLKQIHFLQLQRSVYLTPYKCQEEIEYLREYFGIGEEVLLLEVSKLENESYYKQYFGL